MKKGDVHVKMLQKQCSTLRQSEMSCNHPGPAARRLPGSWKIKGAWVFCWPARQPHVTPTTEKGKEIGILRWSRTPGSIQQSGCVCDPSPSMGRARQCVQGDDELMASSMIRLRRHTSRVMRLVVLGKEYLTVFRLGRLDMYVQVHRGHQRS